MLEEQSLAAGASRKIWFPGRGSAAVLEKAVSMFSRLNRYFAFLLLTAAVVAPATAQETLAWKFAEGGQLKYDVNQAMIMKVIVAGNANTQEIRQTMKMGWDIQKVGANGDALVGQTIERINMDFSGSLIEPFKYDSTDTAPDDQHGAAGGGQLREDSESAIPGFYETDGRDHECEDPGNSDVGVDDQWEWSADGIDGPPDDDSVCDHAAPRGDCSEAQMDNQPKCRSAIREDVDRIAVDFRRN
jgi:hypothetical protein